MVVVSEVRFRPTSGLIMVSIRVHLVVIIIVNHPFIYLISASCRLYRLRYSLIGSDSTALVDGVVEPTDNGDEEPEVLPLRNDH